MTLRRSDKQYLDVESFEEYEFTPCIAYEMAIRNDRVVEIMINRLSNPGVFTHTMSKENDELLSEYALVDSYYHDYHFLIESLKIQEKFYKEFTDFHKSKPEQQKKDIWKSEGNTLRKFVKQDGFLHRSIVAENEMIPYYKENRIYQYFKRPKMQHDIIDNVVSIDFDLSLPENELIAYIKHLKKAYQKDIIVTPYDEFIHKISKTDKNKNSLPKGAKMADIFYIYDCLKLGYTKRKIQNEVYNYYADQGIETKTLDYKTLKKYHDIAIDYIDNKRYLELITGKKLEELEEYKK